MAHRRLNRVGTVLNQHVKALLAGAFYQTIAAGEGGFGVVELTIAHGFADELGIRNLQIAFLSAEIPSVVSFWITASRNWLRACGAYF